MILQLNIFDCDEVIRSADCVFQSLEKLQIECEIDVGELEIKRSERFYTVGKGNEWELLFGDVAACYEFVNRHFSRWDDFHE